MSRSPHRHRGDAAETFTRIVFGELVRAARQACVVRGEAEVRLPRSGCWESGLARVRPALDDALGATAFALAWRWACAECAANAWPDLPRIARHATDHRVDVAGIGALACFADGNAVVESGGQVRWELEDRGRWTGIGMVATPAFDLGPVDAVADIAAAWLDRAWRKA